MKHFDKLYSSLVNESYQGREPSIGDMLDHLLTSLHRNAKTQSGALVIPLTMVSDELNLIIDELNDIVGKAERSSASSEVRALVSKLKKD
jgi:hypothetical protein